MKDIQLTEDCQTIYMMHGFKKTIFIGKDCSKMFKERLYPKEIIPFITHSLSHESIHIVITKVVRGFKGYLINCKYDDLYDGGTIARYIYMQPHGTPIPQ